MIGKVSSGSVKEGIIAILEIDPGQISAGAFVVIYDKQTTFYCIVEDIILTAGDEVQIRVAPILNHERIPPGKLEPGQQQPKPEPTKTIPRKGAFVDFASAIDIQLVFGKPSDQNLIIGHTENNHPVCIDLDKFVQRSSGIFGATGSGKSYIARMIFAGIVKHNKTALLIMDMHNEYGFNDTGEQGNVRGLLSLFGPGKIQVVTLGGQSIRGNQPSYGVEIKESEIRPQDITILDTELNLTNTAQTVIAALYQDYGKKWFGTFKRFAGEAVLGWASMAKVHPAAAAALHSKMQRIFNLPFIKEDPAVDGVEEIVQSLTAGKHIVLSYGDHGHNERLVYLLASNMITRKIRSSWEKMTNEYRRNAGPEPRPLVIAVEEAHILLNPIMASQTIFSTISREMRKYYVTLMVIDQRPSQIYDEVISQLGTRISGQMSDPADTRAAVSGLNSDPGTLSRLSQGYESIIMGWGVPMSIPINTRRYDREFWDEFQTMHELISEEQTLKELGY